MKDDSCVQCGVSFDWPYPKHINGICMDCHREGGSFWGLMSQLMEESEASANER